MEYIIQIKNIGKRYNITGRKRGYVALRDIFSEYIKHPFISSKNLAKSVLGKNRKEVFWALRDINFTVEKGEAVGIIGANGAGKSTLLKILSRITPPTEGEIRFSGRVASLLEVGTGFHPELSGRENIYLNGAILGMTRNEINKKLDEIINFSGIGDFIDTPVKRYSSGMYVRLAFSIAAHIEPDILLVDEVLAVGDAEFQKKCLGKMEEVTGKAGRTILFVSHNMSAVKKICPKTVLLDKGKIVMIGETSKVIEHYLRENYEKSSSSNIFPIREKDLAIHSFDIEQEGNKTASINNDQPFNVVSEIEIFKPLKNFRFGIFLKSALGDTLMRSTISDWEPSRENIEPGIYKVILTIPGKLLMAENYIIELYCGIYGVAVYFSKNNIHKTINVYPPSSYNQAHPTEPRSSNPSIFMLKENSWTINRIGK